MPRYAERTHITQFSLPSAALSGISTGDQDAALDAASQVADSYLGAKFQLPLKTWGDDLRRAVCDVAAWMLIKRRGFSPQAADGGMIREAYDDGLRWLEQVAVGKVVPSGVTDSEATGANATVSGRADAPFVVSPASAPSSQSDGFWRKDDVRSLGSKPGRGW